MAACLCSLRWRCRDRVLDVGAPARVMGILNVTPDSFSDGGRYLDADKAVARGLQMLEEGATIVDVGGESTRPYAEPVSARDETMRVLPVIEGLLAVRPDALLSVDTSKAEVARRALEAGVRIVNDVSALTADAGMADVVRAFGAGLIVMHMRGTPRTMQEAPRYEDVVAEVAGYLSERVRSLTDAGLDPLALAVDPGIGFGKTAEHNVSLLAGLSGFVRMGRPVVVGLSRKRFLERLTGRRVEERLAGSLAGAAWSAWQGAHVVRVHDVRESVDAIAVVEALRRERNGAD